MTNEYFEFLNYAEDFLYGIPHDWKSLLFKIDQSTLYVRTYFYDDKKEKITKINLETFLVNKDFIADQLFNTIPKSKEKEDEKTIAINSNTYRVIDILEEFLFYHMANTSIGNPPIYCNSNFLPEERFNLLLKVAVELIGVRKNYAQLINANNKLLKYCKEILLVPKNNGEDPYQWRATCPTKNGHSFNISTKTNIWNCNKCNKKGNLNDLIKWNNEIKTKHK